LATVSSINLLSILNAKQNVRANTAFISAFNKFPTFNGMELKGERNIGNGVFTITADQDYFDSVVVFPPKQTKPIVDSVFIPAEINKGSSSSMRAIIKNKEIGTSGTILVKASLQSLNINPSSTNIGLADVSIVDFTISASNILGSDSVMVSACSKDQFNDNICDTKTAYFKIIGNLPSIFCGDKICQSSESETMCPIDCIALLKNTSKTTCEQKNIDTPLLGWTWVETSKEVGIGPFGIGNIIGLTKTTTMGECRPQFLIYWVLGGITLFLGATTIILLTLKKRKRK